MRNTQTKFMAAAEALVADTGYELVNDTQWANTGTLKLQPVGEFRSQLIVTYAFNDGGTSLYTLPALPGASAGAAAAPGDEGRFYAKSATDLQQWLEAFAKFVKGLK